MSRYFPNDEVKRPIRIADPPRPQVTPKLVIPRRIVGDWFKEGYFNRFPKVGNIEEVREKSSSQRLL